MVEPSDTFKELQEAVLTTLPGDLVRVEVLRGSHKSSMRFKIRVAVATAIGTPIFANCYISLVRY